MNTRHPIPDDIEQKLNDYPDNARRVLLRIREIILKTAANNPAIGPLSETLKWGEPSFLTTKSKSGSTIRMAWKPAMADHVGLYFNCQTTLVETMRDIYPDSFLYQKNRAALVNISAPLPTDPIAHICEMAMTYHLDKKR